MRPAVVSADGRFRNRGKGAVGKSEKRKQETKGQAANGKGGGWRASGTTGCGQGVVVDESTRAGTSALTRRRGRRSHEPGRESNLSAWLKGSVGFSWTGTWPAGGSLAARRPPEPAGEDAGATGQAGRLISGP